jgi:hypothetical protein
MTNHRPHRPEPGLDGTYEDSCVICLRGTDTLLAFRGPVEWAIAGLAHLGLSRAEATATVENWAAEQGYPDGTVPAGDVTVGVRVCRECAEPSGWRPAIAPLANVIGCPDTMESRP